MSTENSPETSKSVKTAKVKGTPIGRLTLQQIDTALGECDKTVRTHSETVKAKLSSNNGIPTNVLRELSRANTMRSRLMLRRITLLIEVGDAPAMELIDKLIKVKPAKATAV